jgi:hypothetical protein
MIPSANIHMILLSAIQRSSSVAKYLSKLAWQGHGEGRDVSNLSYRSMMFLVQDIYNDLLHLSTAFLPLIFGVCFLGFLGSGKAPDDADAGLLIDWR